MTIKTTYLCDHCRVDVDGTKTGKLYGPLCVTVSAPGHTSEVVTAHFCSLQHAVLWMQTNVGETILA